MTDDAPVLTGELGREMAGKVLSEVRSILDKKGWGIEKRLDHLIKIAEEANRPTKEGMVADYRTRLEANRELAKRAGDYPAEKLDLTAHLSDIQDWAEALDKANAVTDGTAGKPE